MRYVVIGAGSVGATIGGALAAAGREVVLVARGQHLEAMRATGLTLATPSRTLRPSVRSVSGPGELRLGPADVLIMAVKSQDTLPLLVEWGSQPVEGGGIAGELLPLVCAQNGVANEQQALRYFERVYGVCVWLPASLAAPGIVVSEAVPGLGVLDIGRVRGVGHSTGYPSDNTAENLATELTDAGFAAYPAADILPWKYGKLLRNLSNAIQAACGRAISPAATELRNLVVAEGEAVYRAGGIKHVDYKTAYAARGDNFHTSEVRGYPRVFGSTWQSLSRGQATEVDYLNGEIVALGRAYDVRCPANEYLRQVVNGLAHAKTPPGALSAEEILTQVEMRSRKL